MHITKFTIQHFKIFENVTFHFNERINVLTGVNNAGKTTVLEALSLWQECYSKLVRQAGKQVKGLYKQADFTLGVKQGILVSYNEIVSLRSPNYNDIFHNQDVSKDKGITLTCTLEEAGKTIEISICIYPANGGNYRISLNDYETFDYQSFNDRGFIKNPERLVSNLFAAPVAYIPAQEERQHFLKIEQLKNARLSQMVMRNRLENLLGRANELGNPYQRFCDNLSQVLYDDVGLVKFDFPENTKLPMLVLIKLRNELARDISLVGSGTLQIIEILLNIFEKKTELNIILLDEPDSHIHRQLQKRLLRVLETAENSQVFITSHNESLIREADPAWLFHLELSSNRTEPYRPIQRNKSGKPLGLLSHATSPIIQELSGNGRGLDFVNALEADILYMVEGVNDALRLQKILSMKINDTKKYAFWILGSVDEVFSKIEHYATIFNQIKNRQTLWEKTVLVMDKDYMTDTHRQKLMLEIQKKYKPKKIYIWQSYHFESTLFADLQILAKILAQFVSALKPEANTQLVEQYLVEEVGRLASNVQQLCISNIKDLEAEVKQQLGPRRRATEALKMNIFETDAFDKEIDNYLLNSATVQNIHKILNKDKCEQILHNVLAHFDIDFEMEQETKPSFNDLFNHVYSNNLYADWEPVLNP